MRHFETHVGTLPNEADARIAYKAYCSALGNKGYYSKEPLVKFDDLPDKIKVAWCNAAIVVFTRVKDQPKYESKG